MSTPATSSSSGREALPRLGVLVPSTDTTLEQELPKLLDGIASVHVTRMALDAVDEEGLRRMEVGALQAAELLADISPELVLFGCTSGTFILGAEHERRFAERLSVITGAAVVTTAWALLQMLPELGRRIRLRTPYTADLTAAEAGYLSAAGFTVASTAGLGITTDREIAEVGPEQLLALVTEDDPQIRVGDGEPSPVPVGSPTSDGAEVLLLSCTNLRTLDILHRLRETTGLPVLSSNLAAAQAIERLLAGTLSPLAPTPPLPDGGCATSRQVAQPPSGSGGGQADHGITPISGRER